MDIDTLTLDPAIVAGNSPKSLNYPRLQMLISQPALPVQDQVVAISKHGDTRVTKTLPESVRYRNEAYSLTFSGRPGTKLVLRMRRMTTNFS
jgi:hypothetical protein